MAEKLEGVIMTENIDPKMSKEVASLMEKIRKDRAEARAQAEDARVAREEEVDEKAFVALMKTVDKVRKVKKARREGKTDTKAVQKAQEELNKAVDDFVAASDEDAEVQWTTPIDSVEGDKKNG